MSVDAKSHNTILLHDNVHTFFAFLHIRPEDSQLTRAHPLHPLHVAAHRGQILQAVRRDQHDVLDAHPAHLFVAGQYFVVDKLRVANRSEQMEMEIYPRLDRLHPLASVTKPGAQEQAGKRKTYHDHALFKGKPQP